jgi:hypothetical protein
MEAYFLSKEIGMLIDAADLLTKAWRGRFKSWLPFFGWQSFSFCMALMDLLLSAVLGLSKYYLLLLWLTPSFGREILIYFSYCYVYYIFLFKDANRSSTFACCNIDSFFYNP